MLQKISRTKILFAEAALLLLGGYTSLFYKYTHQAGADTAAVGQEQTINSIAGYEETELGAGKPANDDVLSDRNSWRFYQQRRGDLDKEIDNCRQGGKCNPRFAAWVHLIDYVKEVPSHMLKAQLVNGWVNTVIRYDDHIGKIDDFYQGRAVQRYRTPQEILEDGRGMCTEFTDLKFETLKRGGYPQTLMRVVNLDPPSPKDDGHTVFVLNIKGINWVLDNDSFEHPVLDEKGRYLFEKGIIFAGRSDIYPANQYLQENGWSPTTTSTDQIFRKYNKNSVPDDSSGFLTDHLPLKFGTYFKENNLPPPQNVIEEALQVSANATNRLKINAKSFRTSKIAALDPYRFPEIPGMDILNQKSFGQFSLSY